MFTVCPKCTLTLAVTANDLRIGQGYVRCGRCSNVFNALLKLTDVPSEGDAAPLSLAQADPATTSQITRALSSTAEGAPPSPAAPAEAPASPAAPPSAAVPASATPLASKVATSHASPSSAPTHSVPQAAPSAASPAATQLAAAPAVARAGPPAPAPAVPPATRGSFDAPSDHIKEQSTDFDALDRFERVLETLGIDLAEDEPTDSASGQRFPVDITEPQSHGSNTRTFESIVLEGDGVTQTSESVPEEPDDGLNELDALTRRLNAAATEPIAVPSTWPSEPHWHADANHGGARTSEKSWAASLVDNDEPRDGGESAADVPHSDESAIDLDVPTSRLAPSGRRWAWLTGCVVLTVLLSLQAIHHWRNGLAASPFWQVPLTRIYAALGMPLDPRWDLAAYDVRQQGAQSDPSAAQIIRVRLSLANHAQRAQPVPLLRLTLLDRYGKRVAQRDLAPADYWPKGRAMQSFMASDERVDSEIAVRDPNADSASFELDVCLPAGNATHCAGDAAATAANTGSP